MGDYLTASEFKSTITVEVGDQDAEIELAIDASEAAIDEHTQRRFGFGTSAEKSLEFTATSPTMVYIDDLVTISSLKTDTNDDGTFDTTWDASDYRLEPVNAPSLKDARPYTRIAAINGKEFPHEDFTTEVTGTWGWPAVPKPVKQATMIQASRLLKRAREAPFGVAGITFEGAGVRLQSKLDPDVEQLVAPYKVWLVG